MARDKGPRGGWNLLVGWCRKRVPEGTMKVPRRQFLHLAGGAAALPVVPRVAKAQAFPTRPITIGCREWFGGPGGTHAP